MSKEARQRRKWRTMHEVKRRRRRLAISVFTVFFLLFAVLFMANRINSVEVEGNVYYSDEEIENLIINKPLEHNAWYLYWKYKYTATDEIPFIDTVEVSVTGTGKVRIEIYEKGIVGMVSYLDNYMYFDKDGNVVESSRKKIDGVPEINGLEFQNIALYEQLPVEDTKVFNAILNLTKLLKKNEIQPDKIRFNQDNEITLSFGEAKVHLGNQNSLEDKIVRLKYLMADLEGRKGILHMENFNEDTKNITFENIS